MEPMHLHERPALLYSVALMLLGGQLMSMGFLAELFIAYHAPDFHAYSISEYTPPTTSSIEGEDESDPH
jgi:dolichol-phosphate mannosyltransferase